MAGVKISKLKSYEETFPGEYLDDFVDDMIVPVSLGNKTISVTIRELVHFINTNDQLQDEKLIEQGQMILDNTDLINQMTEIISKRIDELKSQTDENEQVTALGLIDIENHIDEISTLIYNKINQLKEEAEEKHKEMIDNQKEVDSNQDERIDDINESINLWEIYGTN